MNITPASPAGRAQRQTAIRRNTDNLPNLDNLRRTYLSATPDDLLEGHEWYSNAHAHCQHLSRTFRIPLRAVVAILAVTSPQKEWARNVSITHDILSTGDPDHPEITDNQSDKVRAILAHPHDDPRLHLGHTARKVRSFYHNILHPLSSHHVTVDRHAEAAYFGHIAQTSTLHRIGAYHTIAAHYRALSRELDLLPHQVQAVIWVVWRREHAPAYSMHDGEAF